GDVTTGAESDIAQITQIARRMIGVWGMNDRIGMVAVLPRDGAPPFASEVGPETLALLDAEVRRFVEKAYAEVVTLLRDERSRLAALADALLEHETLDQEDAYRVSGVDPVAETVEAWSTPGAR